MQDSGRAEVQSIQQRATLKSPLIVDMGVVEDMVAWIISQLDQPDL